MSLFKQRQNKRFSYTPRHLRDKDNQSEPSLESKWQTVRQTGKSKGKKVITLPLLFVILGIVIVIWYLLSN